MFYIPLSLPQNPSTEVQNPSTSNVTLLRIRPITNVASKDKIKSLERALIQCKWYPYNKGKSGHTYRYTCTVSTSYEDEGNARDAKLASESSEARQRHEIILFNSAEKE